MNTSLVLLAFFLISCIVFVVFWLFRSHRFREQKTEAVEVPERPLSKRTMPCLPVPITEISFNDALESSALGVALHDYALKRAALGVGFDISNIVLQGMAIREGSVVFTFSPEGRIALQTGEAVVPIHHGTGKALGVLQDAETGKTFEIAKQGPAALTRTSQTYSILVSCAHIVVSMDTLKRLESIESKVHHLIKGRRIDQLSRLERVYKKAKEKLAGSLSDSTLAELSGYSDVLLELRSIWRREMAEILANTPNPNLSRAWSLIPPVERAVTRKRQAASADHVLKCAELLQMTRLALLTDICLHCVLENQRQFIEKTLTEERSEWQWLQERVEKVLGMFSAVPDVVDTVAGGIKTYAAILDSITARGGEVSLLQRSGASKS